MRGLDDEYHVLTTHLSRVICRNCERATPHVKFDDERWACIDCDRAEIEVVVQNAMNVPTDNMIREAAIRIIDQVNHLITRHSARGPCFDDLVSFANELGAHFPR